MDSLWTVLVTVALVAGCSKEGDSAKPEHKPAPSTKPSAVSDAAVAKKADKTSGTTNGLRWWKFDLPKEALARALESRPRVIGFGEYHEQAGGPDVVPPMARFTLGMLDTIAPFTSDLVFETWIADRRCGKKQVRVNKTVKKQMKRPVHQETTMMKLLKKARKLRIQPHRLQFSCKEYKSLLDKKTKRVVYPNLLRLITKKLGETTEKILAVHKKKKYKRKVIAIYGGAFHNEKHTYDQYAQISYVKAVEKATGGKYVEIDVFVPEIIKGNKRLSKEKFYPLFEQLASDKKVLLIERGDKSFIMIMRRNLKTF